MTTRRRSKVFPKQDIPPPPPKRTPAPDRAPAPRRKSEHKPHTHHQASRNVPPQFKGDTVVCFATGPSLTTEVVETIRPFHESGKVRAAGINDSYRAVDYLDVFYACDDKWWDIHTKGNVVKQPVALMDHTADMWGNQTAWRILRKYPHVNIVQGIGKPGFSTVKNLIHWGNNSGFQLLNLVHLMGAERMILVGYNMGVPDGEEVHFFGKHPEGLSQGGNQYQGFTRNFESIQPEFKNQIINATPNSSLKCFTVRDIKEILNDL